MNYTSYFANYISTIRGDVVVYSNIDPLRNWTGTPTIEIGENEPTTSWFLSGNSETTHNLLLAVRAETQEVADAIRDEIAPSVDRACKTLIECETIEDWQWDEEETAPDIRGVVSGESFYSFVKFKVIERKESR